MIWLFICAWTAKLIITDNELLRLFYNVFTMNIEICYSNSVRT